MSKRKGFTLIELLVVIAIIGIISAIAMVSLTQGKRQARDTKRVADMQQMRNALLIYSNQRANYPPYSSATWTGNLGSAADKTICLDDSDLGFHAGTVGVDDCTGITIMKRVPNENASGTPYIYSKTGITSYTISFTLEGPVGSLTPSGSHICTAKPEGITCP